MSKISLFAFFAQYQKNDQNFAEDNILYSILYYYIMLSTKFAVTCKDEGFLQVIANFLLNLISSKWSA